MKQLLVRLLLLLAPCSLLLPCQLQAQQQSITGTFSITVVSGVSITSTAINGVVGQPYSVQLAATGGTGTGYTWSIASGILPAGISISSAGLLNGTPTASGSSTFTVQATDSAGNKGQKTLTVVIVSPLVWDVPATLPNAIVGSPYSQTLQISGGTTPYTCSLDPASPALLAGLALNANCTVTGTPTAAGGPVKVTVDVKDSGK